MPGSIRLINVNGLSAIVDINTTGTPTEFTAYSDLACTQTVALPATITTDTTFYVKATGVVMLSVTVDGTELAGPARVTLSNAGPATFSLDTDPSNDKSGTLLGLVSTHSSGGSSAVVAYVFPTGDVTTASSANFALDPASIIGAGAAHISVDGSGNLVVNDDGWYQISADVKVISADVGLDYGSFFVFNNGGTPLPADSYFNNAYAEVDNLPTKDVIAGSVITFPSGPLAAGNVFTFGAGRGGTGSITVRLVQLSVVKLG